LKDTTISQATSPSFFLYKSFLFLFFYFFGNQFSGMTPSNKGISTKKDNSILVVQSQRSVDIGERFCPFDVHFDRCRDRRAPYVGITSILNPHVLAML
jgi:hypothetical protein